MQTLSIKVLIQNGSDGKKAIVADVSMDSPERQGLILDAKGEPIHRAETPDAVNPEEKPKRVRKTKVKAEDIPAPQAKPKRKAAVKTEPEPSTKLPNEEETSMAAAPATKSLDEQLIDVKVELGIVKSNLTEANRLKTAAEGKVNGLSEDVAKEKSRADRAENERDGYKTKLETITAEFKRPPLKRGVFEFIGWCIDRPFAWIGHAILKEEIADAVGIGSRELEKSPDEIRKEEQEEKLRNLRAPLRREPDQVRVSSQAKPVVRRKKFRRFLLVAGGLLALAFIAAVLWLFYMTHYL